MKVQLIDPDTVRKGLLFARAINHPIRKKLLEFIALNQGNDGVNVTSIYTDRQFRNSDMELEQSQTSQHLAILRKAGLVNTRRDGKFIFYTVNAEVLEKSQYFLQELGLLYGADQAA